MAEFNFNNELAKGVDLVDLIIHRLTRLIQYFPNANAFYDAGHIFLYKDVNIGFTTDVGGDLYMETIDGAENKSLEQITDARVGTVLSLHRNERKITSAAPTICVSAINGRWITHQVPVVFPKTSLIVGVNRKLLTPRQGEIHAALTFGYDHRVLSGLAVSKLADDLIQSIIN
jgi:pyruvate/2-oxoglutarate dehydrogenase complex dihydrolipoamide acyltransferase (E2) component